MRRSQRFFFFFLWASLLSLNPILADDESLPPLPQGPLLLTSVTPEQLSADYWINRLPEPDRVLKTPEELKGFNEAIHLEIKERVDIFKMDLVRRGRPIREQLELEYNTVKGRVLFGVDDQRIPEGLFEQEIKPRVQWEKVPAQIQMRWGAAVKATSVRALPSDVKMLEKLRDVEFDQLQFTLIKLWTPVGIFHESSDGPWLYIQAPYVRGWVKAKDIAVFRDRDSLQKVVKSKDFLVVTGESTPIFRGPDLKEVLQRPSMGTILPLAVSPSPQPSPQRGEGEILKSPSPPFPPKDGSAFFVAERGRGEGEGDAYSIWIPTRKRNGQVKLRRAYVDSKSDVTKGFLPYTQRNIIRQSFKLLGARYGWGGTYNGRDCSGFTHDVFLSLGVEMPRGSKEQGFVGTQINHFEYKENAKEKIEALRAMTPGVGLLRMPKHQMLYLGEINGRFYAIHSTWAERISMTSDEKNRINQVVVSDLTLNGNSYLGSLFDRIISASEVN